MFDPVILPLIYSSLLLLGVGELGLVLHYRAKLKRLTAADPELEP